VHVLASVNVNWISLRTTCGAVVWIHHESDTVCSFM
jgi:hypothetical protein